MVNKIAVCWHDFVLHSQLFLTLGIEADEFWWNSRVDSFPHRLMDHERHSTYWRNKNTLATTTTKVIKVCLISLPKINAKHIYHWIELLLFWILGALKFNAFFLSLFLSLIYWIVCIHYTNYSAQFKHNI